MVCKNCGRLLIKIWDKDDILLNGGSGWKHKIPPTYYCKSADSSQLVTPIFIKEYIKLCS